MRRTDNKYCLECGKPRKSVEKFCRHCGSQFPKEKRSWFYKFMAFIGAMVLLLFIIALFSPDKNNEPVTQSDSVTTNSSLPPNVAESVVNVYCPYYGEPMTFESEGYGGSGTVVTDDGMILTNSHVIPQDEKSINTNEEGCFVIFPDQKTGAPKEIYIAKPIVLNDVSDKYDLAFLEINDVFTDIDGYSYGSYPRTFPALSDENCDGKELELGEKILVYGYPSSTGGISLTVTEGLISTISQDGIFTSAKIDQGNSGGLATDSKGCFIGVPSAVSSGEYESYGIIVPSNTVSDFMDEVGKLIDQQEGNI